MASLVFALALMVSMVGVAAAHHQDDHDGGPGEACENAENPPDWCDDEDPEDPEDPGDEPDSACTAEDKDGLEGTDVASGIVEQVRQGAADGGAPAELTDGVDTLNCEVIVTVEQAIEGDGGGGEDPAPPEDCSGVVEAMAENGAPPELTDGAQQLCDAIEGDGGGGGDPIEQIGEGCDTLVGELAGLDPNFEEGRAVCDGLEEVPTP